MSNIGFKISKPGEDVNTSTGVLLSSGSEYNAFRIVKKTINSGSHSFGFSPSFLAFRPYENGEYITDLRAYVGDDSYSVSNVGYYDENDEWVITENGYIVLLANPAFNAPGTLDSKGLIQISTTGKSVLSAKSSEMVFDGNYEQMQIHTVLDMSIDLPEEEVDPETSVTRTLTMAHGLNYLPIINPSCSSTMYSADGIDLNFSGRTMEIVNFTMGMNKSTSGTVTFDSTNVYLRVTRGTALSPETFLASTATASVTVFTNRLDEVVDYSV